MVSIYRGERSSFRGASYFYVDRFHCLCHIFWISGLFLCFRLYCFDSKSLSWMKVKDWIPRPPDSHLCANVLLNLHSLHSLTYLDHTDVLEVIWTLLHRHISEVSANPWCICLLSNLFLFRSTFRWNYRFLVRMKSEKWYIFFWNFNFVYTEIWRLNPGRVIFFSSLIGASVQIAAFGYKSYHIVPYFYCEHYLTMLGWEMNLKFINMML